MKGVHTGDFERAGLLGLPFQPLWKLFAVDLLQMQQAVTNRGSSRGRRFLLMATFADMRHSMRFGREVF
jgi:hypothetical protein